MKVVINGEDRVVTEGITIRQLLDELSLKAEATVVQRNDDIVDRARFGDTRLAEGDVVELIRFVGGG